MPRFIRKRDGIVVQHQDGHDWPRIDLGTRGAPYFELPFYVRGEPLLPPGAPRPEAVVGIVQQHTLAIRYPHEQMGKATLPEDLPPAVQQVQVIGEAEPVWIITQAYFPPSGYSKASWRMRDPFGLGDSQHLKTLVEKQAEAHDALRDKLDRLFESEAEILSRKSNDLERQIREEERLEVQREFGGMCDDERLLEKIGEFVYAFHQAKRISHHKGDSVWQKAQIVLETLFNQMKDHQYMHILLKQRLELDPIYIRYLYQSLGGHEVPERLSKVQGNQAAGWIKHGNGSLRPMTIATLWVAHQLEAHPFRKMIAELPDIFDWIERISVSRDKVSHGGPSSEPASISTDETKKNLYSILKSYLTHTFNQRLV